MLVAMYSAQLPDPPRNETLLPTLGPSRTLPMPSNPVLVGMRSLKYCPLKKIFTRIYGWGLQMRISSYFLTGTAFSVTTGRSPYFSTTKHFPLALHRIFLSLIFVRVSNSNSTCGGNGLAQHGLFFKRWRFQAQQLGHTKKKNRSLKAARE